MTVTSPASGARAPRRRSTRRLLATGLAVLLALGVAAPALAATPTPEPSASADAFTGTRDLSLTPQSSGLLRAGQALTVTIGLANGLGAATPATSATLSLGTQPLADRATLDTWLDGTDTDPSGQDVGATVLAGTEGGTDTSAVLTVLADDPALAGRAPGVYTLRATATVDDDELTARSVVIVPAETTTPIGVVVPITAGALESGLLSAESLEQLTAPGGALTAQLGAVEGTAAIVAVDPAIPAAIRVLGNAAPASAVDWLDRLMALPNSRFALQFGDADVATQLQAGLTAPLAPTSLLAYMSATDFDSGAEPTPSPSPSPSPSATPAPEGPVYPDLATLTDIGGEPRPSTYWPATGSAGADVVAGLATPGADGVAPITLLASTSTTAGAAGGTVAAPASVDGASVLVYDDAVSADLTAGVDEASPTARADALVAATAHLSFAAADAGGRPLLVTVDRGAERERADLRTAISAAYSAAGGGPLSLEQLVATPAEPVGVVEVAADVERTADTTLLMGDEAALAGFATILDDPQLLTGPQRAEILQLLGVAWQGDPDAFDLAITAHRTATTETLDSVGIVSTNVVLVSYGSEGFRPYVRNDLDYPVNLVLTANSDSSSLEVGARKEIIAQAASNTLVSLPIEARIANATAIVSMQLYSPTGVVIGAVESATVEVHAEWETIGLVILGALMVLFLAGGIVRTVLRRRARRADVGAPDAEGPADGAVSPHPGVAPEERP